MNSLLTQIKLLTQILVLTRKKLIYQVAVDSLGIDISPEDLATDEYGCAESVTNVLKKAGAFPAVITGTWTLYMALAQSPKWTLTSTPRAGDVIISPTGMGGKNKIGHVGILGKNGLIMSNDSWTGKWSSNYSIDTWKAKYKTFPVYYFTLV